jgi:hypothetical protein
MRAQAAVAKAEREWFADELSGTGYERLAAKYGAEQAAAEAQATQLAERERAVAAEAAQLDAEQEALRKLAEVRRQIVGRVREAGVIDADGHAVCWYTEPSRDLIAAARAALLSVFEGFLLHHADPAEYCEVIDGYTCLKEDGPDFPVYPDEWPEAGERCQYVLEPRLREGAFSPVPLRLAQKPHMQAKDKYSLGVSRVWSSLAIQSTPSSTGCRGRRIK